MLCFSGRCVILSFDDGTMKVISLVKAASDDPVTGMAGTKQPGLHNLSCLPFAIWSVHVSRLTGISCAYLSMHSSISANYKYVHVNTFIA